MKVFGSVLVVLVGVISLTGCGLAGPMAYSFHDVNTTGASNFSSIKAERRMNDGALIIRKLDGNDTRKQSVLAEQAKTNPILIEPRLITVTPGHHTFGFLYVFTDLSGKLVTGNMATEFQKKYLPNNKDQYITVKHYEEFAFSSNAGLVYVVDYHWNRTAKEISFSIRECDSTEKKCTNMNIKPTNVKSTAVSGWSVSDIE